MLKHNFLEILDESAAPLLGDGAMGTMLHAQGFSLQGCFDELNLTRPETVEGIHSLYLQAGAQIIQTNTFGGNRYKLAAHGLQERVGEINQSGVKLAKQAVLAASHPAYVAGDVGPLGVRLAPYGRVQPEDGCQAFREQIAVLAQAGADLIVLETFSDLNEILQALSAARSACDLPVLASMTFTRDDRTVLGDAPIYVARSLHEAGADVIGINCSGGPAQVWRIVRQMRQALPQARFSVMPNAGWPEQVGGRIMYPANPEYFGEYALAFCEAGVRVLAGCCGTTPQHIHAMRLALDSLPEGCGPSVVELSMPAEVEEQRGESASPSRMAQKLKDGKFIVSVEMDPPRGLSVHKLIAGASLLAEAGADVINVADSPMARMRMSPWAVCQLIQRQVGVESVLHFPTRGRNLLRVQGDLLAAHAMGIRNVFVVMGDPTAIGDYPNAMDNYDLVPSGLIQLITAFFNAGLDHAGSDIGQPTAFFVGCALNLCPANPEQEIKTLHRKLQAGAQFILTQPVYQVEEAESLLEKYERRYGPLETPLLAGVLPLFSSRHATFLHNEVPGIHIPESMQSRLKLAGDKAPQEGVRMALELIDQMKSWARGIYLMPAFNRYDLAAEVAEGCR